MGCEGKHVDELTKLARQLLTADCDIRKHVEDLDELKEELARKKENRCMIEVSPGNFELESIDGIYVDTEEFAYHHAKAIVAQGIADWLDEKKWELESEETVLA